MNNDMKYSLVRILKGVTRPLGIVKNRQDLAGWEDLDDLGRCTRLWAAMQNGPVVLEFYKVGLTSVKDAFRQFQMVNEH